MSTPAAEEQRANASDASSRSGERRLLVILPALDEETMIADVIARIPKRIEGIDRVDVLVVDDGSTDRTAEIARAAGATVVSHARNRGVGAAMQTGIDEAVRRGVDFAVNIDADGQFKPEDIPTLLAPVRDGQAEFATASRFARRDLTPQMTRVKLWGNWGMARLVSLIIGQRFHDVSCGFRCYTREAMLRLNLTGNFTYTQESFLLLAQKGFRMVEVPLEVRGVREHGVSRVASDIPRYALRASNIIYTVVRDYAPGMVFNAVAGLFAVFGLGLAAFFFGHRLLAGTFTPHIWSGFMAAFFLGLAMLFFALGQIAVMISRLRLLHERELYILRKHLDRIETGR